MPSKHHRIERINAEMRRELPQVMSKVLSSYPNISFVSVTAVEVTRDLAYAKIFVTHILADAQVEKDLVSALNAAAPKLRMALAKAVNLRKMPELSFFYDQSIAYGAKMDALLSDLVSHLPDESCSEQDGDQEEI